MTRGEELKAGHGMPCPYGEKSEEQRKGKMEKGEGECGFG